MQRKRPSSFLAIKNSPCSICWNFSMTPRLSGHFLVLFGFLCAQVSSGNCEAIEWWKFAIFSLKLRSHVRILINRMRAIEKKKRPKISEQAKTSWLLKMIVRVYEIQLDRCQLLFQKNLEDKRFVHFLVSVKWFIFSSIKYLLVKTIVSMERLAFVW